MFLKWVNFFAFLILTSFGDSESYKKWTISFHFMSYSLNFINILKIHIYKDKNQSIDRSISTQITNKSLKYQLDDILFCVTIFEISINRTFALKWQFFHRIKIDWLFDCLRVLLTCHMIRNFVFYFYDVNKIWFFENIPLKIKK